MQTPDGPAQRQRQPTLHPARRAELHAITAQSALALIAAAVMLALVLVTVGFAMGRATRVMSTVVTCECR